VLIVGGGDSAVDWALGLQGIASEITLIHRRDQFRAHKASVDQMRALQREGKLSIRTPYEVRDIQNEAGCVRAAVIYHNDTDEDLEIPVDAVIALLGFKPDLGPISRWGLELERNSIKVSPLMETNLEGVYAAGDITHYPGKLELIATGYGEAAMAVNNAVHYLNPKARVNPGHSTNLKVFAQEEEPAARRARGAGRRRLALAALLRRRVPLGGGAARLHPAAGVARLRRRGEAAGPPGARAPHRGPAGADPRARGRRLPGRRGQAASSTIAGSTTAARRAPPCATCARAASSRGSAPSPCSWPATSSPST
jgi:hypothetical protein